MSNQKLLPQRDLLPLRLGIAIIDAGVSCAETYSIL